MTAAPHPSAARRLVDRLERNIVDLDAVLEAEAQAFGDDAATAAPGGQEPPD